MTGSRRPNRTEGNRWARAGERGCGAAAKMPASVARLLPRLRPSRPSPVFLLSLLASLRGPVCGRAPHSVPRTSLPISGKARASSPLALGSRSRSRLQAPKPTRPYPRGRTPRPQSSAHGFLRCPSLARMQAGPPRGAAAPARATGLLRHAQAAPAPPYLCSRLSQRRRRHRAPGRGVGLPETVHFQLSRNPNPSSLTCTCVRHVSLMLSNPSIFHTTPNTHPSDYSLAFISAHLAGSLPYPQF